MLPPVTKRLAAPLVVLAIALSWAVAGPRFAGVRASSSLHETAACKTAVTAVPDHASASLNQPFYTH
jgi:hypothetical protein